jgi:hypothetical protein
MGAEGLMSGVLIGGALIGGAATGISSGWRNTELA